MINKDALEYISSQAIKAQPQVFQAAAEPKDVYFLRDGEVYRRIEAEPAPRNYAAATIDYFVSLVRKARSAGKLPEAKRIGPDGEPSIEPLSEYTIGPSLIMVGKQHVTALVNEHHRRERVHFPLTMNLAFGQLVTREVNRRALGQKEFVSLLRVDLNGCVAPTIVANFKSLKFEKKSEGESQISNSNKAVSQKIQMSLVSGGQPIPDEIEVSVAVFEEFPSLRQVVRCAVETNIEDATFTLIPLAGELTKASVLTREYIVDQIVTLMDAEIQDNKVIVFSGEIDC